MRDWADETGFRTDKKQSFNDKVKAVEDLLQKEK